MSIFSQVSGRPAGNKLRFVSCGCGYTTTTLMFMVSITWAVLQNVENRHTGKFFNFKKNTLDKPKVYHAHTKFQRFFAFLLLIFNLFRANCKFQILYEFLMRKVYFIRTRCESTKHTVKISGISSSAYQQLQYLYYPYIYVCSNTFRYFKSGTTGEIKFPHNFNSSISFFTLQK